MHIHQGKCDRTGYPKFCKRRLHNWNTRDSLRLEDQRGFTEKVTLNWTLEYGQTPFEVEVKKTFPDPGNK